MDNILHKKITLLTLTNWQIDTYNNLILKHINGQQHIYLVADSIKEWVGLTREYAQLCFQTNTTRSSPSHVDC